MAKVLSALITTAGGGSQTKPQHYKNIILRLCLNIKITEVIFFKLALDSP